MKVFFDTNILIDVLANRQPFYENSATLWTLSERRTITGLVSVLTFTNTFYIVRHTCALEFCQAMCLGNHVRLCAESKLFHAGCSLYVFICENDTCSLGGHQ